MKALRCFLLLALLLGLGCQKVDAPVERIPPSVGMEISVVNEYEGKVRFFFDGKEADVSKLEIRGVNCRSEMNAVVYDGEFFYGPLYVFTDEKIMCDFLRFSDDGSVVFHEHDGLWELFSEEIQGKVCYAYCEIHGAIHGNSENSGSYTLFGSDFIYSDTVSFQIESGTDESEEPDEPEPSDSVIVTQVEKVYMGFDAAYGKRLYWASCNLGAESPEDYGGLYGWADPTGEKRSMDLDDYPSANPPENIAGTQYDIAHQKLGGGWRIPSSNEMWSLISHCTSEWVSVNGVEGILYTSKVNGNTLFFPVTPVREGESVKWLSEDRLWTQYWLSTLNDEDKANANTFQVRYSEGWGDDNIADYPTVGYPRYFGFPIRPVTEEE